MLDGLHRHHKLLFFKVGLHTRSSANVTGPLPPSWLTDRQNQVERPLPTVQRRRWGQPQKPNLHVLALMPFHLRTALSPSPDGAVWLHASRGLARPPPGTHRVSSGLGLGQSPRGGLRYVLAPGVHARKTGRCYTGKSAPSLEPYLQVTPSYRSKIRACSTHNKLCLPRMGLGASATGVSLTGCLRTPLRSKC